jgi:hypothetical protein
MKNIANFETRADILLSWLRANLRVSYSPVIKQIDYFHQMFYFI